MAGGAIGPAPVRSVLPIRPDFSDLAMKFARLASLLVAPLTLAPALGTALAQTSWYVDASSAGPGTGTSGDPFPTLASAFANPALVDGDEILVRPGVYTENVFNDRSVDLIATGDASNTVLEATDGPIVEVGFQDRTVIQTIRGFHFRGSSTQVGVLDPVYNSSIRIDRCVFSDLAVGIDNLFGVVNVVHCDLTRCDIGLRARGAHITYLQESVLWGNDDDVYEELFHVEDRNCQFADPINFGLDDFHRRRVSPAIDAGPVGPGFELDPDGTAPDLGALRYDASHPNGDTFCFNPANSTGEARRMRVTGTTSLTGLQSGGTLTLNVESCPASATGVFLWGTTPSEIPIASGSLCVGGAILRLDVVQTDGDGRATHALDAAMTQGLVAGDERPVQFWHRDTTSAGMGATSAVLVRFVD